MSVKTVNDSVANAAPQTTIRQGNEQMGLHRPSENRVAT